MAGRTEKKGRKKIILDKRNLWGRNFFHKQKDDNLKKDHTNKSTKKSEKVIHHRYDLRGEEEGKQSRIFFSKYIVIIFKLMSFFVTLIDI